MALNIYFGSEGPKLVDPPLAGTYADGTLYAVVYGVGDTDSDFAGFHLKTPTSDGGRIELYMGINNIEYNKYSSAGAIERQFNVSVQPASTKFKMIGLPTVAPAAGSGEVWNDAGVLKIA